MAGSRRNTMSALTINAPLTSQMVGIGPPLAEGGALREKKLSNIGFYSSPARFRRHVARLDVTRCLAISKRAFRALLCGVSNKLSSNGLFPEYHMETSASFPGAA